MALSTFPPLLNHARTHHIGALSFLIADILLLFGAAALTISQALQPSTIAKWKAESGLGVGSWSWMEQHPYCHNFPIFTSG
ncbi:hypothetical protein V6N13_031093 [Hibiscus sabdariffa]|uniref:Uncharacterized protein n=1 Tax=Hibiscus sabdariffa TaxID=183260 RepID=A0ABR2CLD7_9ROSI